MVGATSAPMTANERMQISQRFRVARAKSALFSFLVAFGLSSFASLAQQGGSPARTHSNSIPSQASHRWFGHAIAILGDLDKDGCSEIAVGSPISDGSGLGSVMLYSGRTFERLGQIDGDSFNDEFGSTVEEVPDQDGDGLADILVGSPWPSLEGRGCICVFSSKTHELLKRAVATKDETSLGAGACVLRGADGHAEGVIATAITTRRVGTKNESFLRYDLLSLPDLDRRWTVESHREEFVEAGVTACSIPDMNDDGLCDVAIRMKGCAAILSGKTGDVLMRIVPRIASPRFGWSICSIADLDGDGVADIAVGDPGDLYSNDSEGLVEGYSTKTSARLWSSLAGKASDMGFAMDVTVDLNHDGVRDLAVSKFVPFADGVSFLSGRDGSLIRDVSRVRLKEDNFLPSLGYRLSASGTFGADRKQGLVVSRYSPKCAGSNGQSVWVIDVEGHLLAEILPPANTDAPKRPPSPTK